MFGHFFKIGAIAGKNEGKQKRQKSQEGQKLCLFVFFALFASQSLQAQKA